MENSITKEDMVTKAIEKQTVKLPSDTFSYSYGCSCILPNIKTYGQR